MKLILISMLIVMLYIAIYVVNDAVKDMGFSEFIDKFFMIPCFVLLGIMLVIVLPLFGVPVRHKATIKAFEWERTTYIQEYQTIRKEGWYLPEGAKEVSHELKKKEDIFSRDEDLYSHWYVYDINEWVDVKKYQDNGEGKKPYSVDKRTLDIPEKSEVNEPQLGDKCQRSNIYLVVIAQPKDEPELTFKQSSASSADVFGIIQEAKDKLIGDKISYGSETNVWNLIFS